MAGPLKKYAYINAKLRARIGNMLEDSVFNHLSESDTVEEALSKLRDTEFSVLDEVYRKTGDLKIAELKLNEKELDIYKNLIDKLIGPASELVQILSDKFMIENIKFGLRLFFEKYINKRDISGKVQYLLNAPGGGSMITNDLINAENLNQVKNTLKKNYYSFPASDYIDTLTTEPSLFKAEISIDTLYYKTLTEKINNLKGKDLSTAQRIIGVKIDILNLNTAFRLKTNYKMTPTEIDQFMINGGFYLPLNTIKESIKDNSFNTLLKKVGNTSIPVTKENQPISSKLLIIEEILNSTLKDEVRKILSGYPFTIGIVLAYFSLKSEESNKVRTILNGINYNIDSNRIKDMI